MDLSKATGFTAYLPTEGLFRSSDSGGAQGSLYRRVGNRIEEFDIASLLTPEEKARLQNYGEMASAGRAKLEQMGVKYDALPAYNIGDINTAAAKEGLQVASKAGPSGGPDWYIHKGADLKTLVQEKPQASTGSRALEFNTPSDIATAKSQLESAVLNKAPEQKVLGTSTTMGGGAPNITRNLTPGMSGDDIKSLQSFLISQGFNIPAGATGYYGDQTKAAVAAWQAKSGVDAGADAGFFGPKSRAMLADGATTKEPSLDDTVSQFDTLTELALSSGKTINPNLTPEQIAQIDPAEFLRQAEASIAPEYKQKFDLLKRDLTTNLSRLGYDLGLKEKETQQAFEKTNLEGGEELAGRGLAFSSNEQNFRQQTKEARDSMIAAAQEAAYRSGTDVTRKAEELGGTETLAGTALPSIGGRPLSLTGTAQAPIIGSYQRDRQSLIESLAKENETQARNRQAYATRDLSFA